MTVDSASAVPPLSRVGCLGLYVSSAFCVAAAASCSLPERLRVACVAPRRRPQCGRRVACICGRRTADRSTRGLGLCGNAWVGGLELASACVFVVAFVMCWCGPCPDNEGCWLGMFGFGVLGLQSKLLLTLVTVAVGWDRLSLRVWDSQSRLLSTVATNFI